MSIEPQMADEVIDKLGGTRAVARLTGLTDGNISNWRRVQKKLGGQPKTVFAGIPKPWRMYIREKFPGVIREPEPSICKTCKQKLTA